MSRADIARSRYAQSFESEIFQQPGARASARFVPAGKRRDQTTTELFGEDYDKSLRAKPKTFVPRDPDMNPRERRQHFLQSDGLSRSPPPRTLSHTASTPVLPRRPLDTMLSADSDVKIDPVMRRQQELSSELFGRETPAVDPQEAHDKSKRLQPNDFTWFSFPEHTSTGEDANMNHRGRSYQEKCSNILNRQTPAKTYCDVNYDEEQDVDAESKRRANAYYSDLFGRPTPMPSIPVFDGRHPKLRGPDEEQVIVHQDWMNSKTELMPGARAPAPVNVGERKKMELHSSNIFGGTLRSSASTSVLERGSPLVTDNSQKTRSAFGKSPRAVHQAHLQSSLADPNFYQDAYGARSWEVAELHLTELPAHTDESSLRRMCQGSDLQIVKVAVEMDCVRNICKGRAKIRVRYNPERNGLQSLVDKFQAVNVVVAN